MSTALLAALPVRSPHAWPDFAILGVAMETPPSPDDAQLMANILNKDPAAFEALYDRYARVAYGLAYSILSDPTASEDVVQDAFLTLWRQAENYGKERGSVRSWLLAIVHHRAIDYIRRRHDDRRQPVEALVDISAPDDTFEQARQGVEGGAVRHALDRLPPDQRHSLILAYFGGYTHDEIAHLLDVPLGTVKGRLRIGLRKMRAYLRVDEVEVQG